jgi:hypothetical protein
MKNITLQLGKKITEEDLEKAGFKISNWANDILQKVKFKKQIVNLEVKTVAELGLPNGGTIKEIYEKAQEVGLELCPAEVGPQLRVQYDRPENEWLLIAMKPITDRDGNLRVFLVARDGAGRWLHANYGHADYFWSGHYHWVFVSVK